jgi:hypothetical protein
MGQKDGKKEEENEELLIFKNFHFKLNLFSRY